MRYYKLRKLKNRFDGPVFTQVKKILRGLCSSEESEIIQAEQLLSLFSYQEQIILIRFLKRGEI